MKYLFASIVTVPEFVPLKRTQSYSSIEVKLSNQQGQNPAGPKTAQDDNQLDPVTNT